MTKRKVYLAIQAVVCVALVLLFCIAAVDIYREGLVRKAEHPLESIYTREIAAEKFAPIAPLFFTGVGLMIAGLVLGAEDENARKAVEDSEIRRDLIAGRVAQPSDAMRRAQAEQKRWLLTGWGAFSLCMVPVLLYMVNPGHFPLDDLEGMFLGLIGAVLPWTAVGLGALAVCSTLRGRSVGRETEAARQRLREEREAGIKPEPKAAPQPGSIRAVQIALIVVAFVLIIAGIFNGSARDVLFKAINICTECVGLG